MIRPVNINDAPQITSIYNHYIRESVITFETAPLSVKEMEKRIESISGQFPYFVFEVDGKIAGYCYAHLWKEKAAYSATWESTIYLLPSYFGEGIGSQMLTHLIEKCREAGCHSLIACITEGNNQSFSLHEKFGFKRVSHFSEAGFKFDRWLDIIDYQLIL